MTEQMAINLIELQFISISNPLRKKWMRPHIQEFKRQKIQGETGYHTHFPITDYLEKEIKKIKSISFAQKRWLEICLKLFKELENISLKNYALIYLIILQVFMSSNTYKKEKIQKYLKLLQKYTRTDSPISLEKISNSIKREIEDRIFNGKASIFETDWATECQLFLEHL